MRVIIGLTVLVLLVGSLGVLPGCGGARLLSRGQEIELGTEAAAEFERDHPVEQDTQRARLIAEIGSRISRQAIPPEYPYEYKVCKADEVNAVAFPGGRIYFWTGLFEEINDPDQLAWIAGHETAHVKRQHVCRQLEKALGYQLLLELLTDKETTGRTVGVIATELLSLKYSRSAEREADRIGIDLAAAAGYDPTACIPVLQTFKRLAGGGGLPLGKYLSSHPSPDNRLQYVREYLTEQRYSGRYLQP